MAIASMQVNVLRFSRSFVGGHEVEVELEQDSAPQVARLLAERLGQGLSFQINEDTLRLQFRPGPTSAWRHDDDLLTVELAPGGVEELCAGLAAAEANAPIVLSELPDLKFRCVER